MKTITFANGEKVCALGQGTWKWGLDPLTFDRDERALREGIDLGMNMVDTAEMYDNEETVGRAIRPVRSSVFLVSKVSPDHASYRDILDACEGSLRRLNTEWLDLYLLHWKGPYPLDDTVKAMTELQQSGKIRMWGVSNIGLDDMEYITQLPGGGACAADQMLYNLSERGLENNLLPWAERRHLPIVAYKPLGRGEFLNDPVLASVAGKHSATSAQIALAWTIQRPGVMTITKASTVEHVRENFAALDIRLDDDDLRRLDNAFPRPAEWPTTSPENKKK